MFIAMPVAARTTLEVFTTHAAPVNVETSSATFPVDVTVYTVDDIEHLNQTLSDDLSSELATAKADANARLSHLDATQIEALQHTGRGLALAFELGVEKLPAWVFDRQVVVYGVRDEGHAWQAYQQWKATAR